MFEGFTTTDIETAGARVHLRHGGDGPPLLLLHGNPLTHVSWHKIANRLAEPGQEVDPGQPVARVGSHGSPPKSARAASFR